MVEKCRDCDHWLSLSTPIIASSQLNTSVGICSLVPPIPEAAYNEFRNNSGGFRANQSLRSDIGWCEDFSTVARLPEQVTEVLRSGTSSRARSFGLHARSAAYRDPADQWAGHVGLSSRVVEHYSHAAKSEQAFLSGVGEGQTSSSTVVDAAADALVQHGSRVARERPFLECVVKTVPQDQADKQNCIAKLDQDFSG